MKSGHMILQLHFSFIDRHSHHFVLPILSCLSSNFVCVQIALNLPTFESLLAKCDKDVSKLIRLTRVSDVEKFF